MRIRCGVLVAVLVVAAAATPSQAQWAVTPYIGVNTGDVETGKLLGGNGGGLGGSVGHLGGGLDFEFDVERHFHFFHDPDIGNAGSVLTEDVNTRATSFMGSVVVPLHVTGATSWRPYGTAGLGVIRASFLHTAPNQPDVHQNDLAFNFSGGVMYRLSPRVGFRGDLRYFRVVAYEDKALPAGQRGDLNGVYRDYGFWRTTFGVTVGFSGLFKSTTTVEAPREARRR
jgi:Outer membrane protein beta-barrel domain